MVEGRNKENGTRGQASAHCAQSRHDEVNQVGNSASGTLDLALHCSESPLSPLTFLSGEQFSTSMSEVMGKVSALLEDAKGFSNNS